MTTKSAPNLLRPINRIRHTLGRLLRLMCLMSLLVGCSSTNLPPVTPFVSPLPSPTQAAGVTPVPSATPAAPATASPTAVPTLPVYDAPTRGVADTATPVTPSPTPVDETLITAYADPVVPLPGEGQPLSISAPALALDNLPGLRPTAQWGWGQIVAIAVSPDETFFVAGSSFGLALYDPQDMAHPRWLAFEYPVYYGYTLAFSADSQYLKLVMPPSNYGGATRVLYLRLADGQYLTAAPANQWLPWNTDAFNSGSGTVTSPDGRLRFRSETFYQIMEFDLEFDPNDLEARSEEHVRREMYLAASGDLHYTFSDPAIYITVQDRSEPQGCDIEYWSACGNAMMPLLSAPYQVQFSPDSQRLGVLYRPFSLGGAEYYGRLRIYDSRDGRLLEEIGSMAEPVASFAFTPSGDLLLVNLNGELRWLDAQGRTRFSDWRFNAPIQGLAYSADGRYVLIQRMQHLEVRQAADGALLRRHAALVFALQPGSSLLAFAAPDGEIMLRDLDEERILRRWPGHKGKLYAMTFSPDGRFLATSGRDCSIRLWDVAHGRLLYEMEPTAVEPMYGEIGRSRVLIEQLEFLPDGRNLLGYGSWGTLVNWDVGTGTRRYAIQAEALEFYNGMMTLDPHYPAGYNGDPDKQVLYIGEGIYDVHTGERLGDYKPPTPPVNGCSTHGVVTLDGQVRITTGYDKREGQLCLLDAADGHRLRSVALFKLRSAALIAGIVMHPDGRSLLVGFRDGTIRIYQIAAQ